MDLGLKGKVALVTGASEGIGLAVARGLLLESARVAICARTEDTLREAGERLIAETGGEALAIPADMSRLDDIRRFVRRAHERFGRIDILVNNAGASIFGGFFDVPDERWIGDITLKLIGYVRTCREVIPMMQRQGGGRIVNVGGNGGRQPLPYHMPGGAANAAILNFTKSLADQVARDRIYVNVVAPGPVVTRRFEKQLAENARRWSVSLEEARRRFAAELPLGYVPRADEVASTIVFLASDRAAYVTGTCVTVDGGITKGL